MLGIRYQDAFKFILVKRGGVDAIIPLTAD